MKKDILYPICLGVTAMITICCLYVCCKAVDALDSINNRMDRANVEYQFVVTDSTITVWDDNRWVGTVKLEGQLDSLIISDNQ
jgi:hypothetical protein